MIQLPLPLAPIRLNVGPFLPCAFGQNGEGWSGPHHCALCAAEVDRMIGAFNAAVERGEFNSDGSRKGR
jgi:hypothetical protein